MGFEPWRPQRSDWHSPKADDFKPADEDVIRTLAEIEKASTPLPSATSDTPLLSEMTSPSVRTTDRGLANVQVRGLAVAIGAAVGFVILGLNFLGNQASTGKSRRGPARVTSRSALNPATQAEAEQLLQKLAAGESGAADQVLAQSSEWTRTTQRSPKSEQSIGIILNLADLHAREAGLQAEMALDGVAVSESGFQMVERAVSNPSQRVWALWMLGALGNRGVDAEHAAKIIGAYLSDPQVDVRAAAVNGLSLVGTDETIPLMLDRFRNDPSPIVQERAACSLAESGMYRHEQRMTAAASFAGWLDDSQLSVAQRAWALHALRDISGQNLGNDPGAWREWYTGAR